MAHMASYPVLGVEVLIGSGSSLCGIMWLFGFIGFIFHIGVYRVYRGGIWVFRLDRAQL